MNQPIRITLAAARVNAGFTQREAAKLLEINVATLQNYERGKTCPSWEVVRKMEDIYEMSSDYFNFDRS